MSSNCLTATSLKDSLWETLNRVKSRKLLPGHADAIASQAREILRTVKIQLAISGHTNRLVPYEVIEFSEGKKLTTTRQRLKPSRSQGKRTK